MLRDFLNHITEEERTSKGITNFTAWCAKEKKKEVKKTIYLYLIDSAQHGKNKEFVSPITLRGFYSRNITDLPRNELYELVYETTIEIADGNDLDYFVERLDTEEGYRITLYWGDDEFKYERYDFLYL